MINKLDTILIKAEKKHQILIASLWSSFTMIFGSFYSLWFLLFVPIAFLLNHYERKLFDTKTYIYELIIERFTLFNHNLISTIHQQNKNIEDQYIGMN